MPLGLSELCVLAIVLSACMLAGWSGKPDSDCACRAYAPPLLRSRLALSFRRARMKNARPARNSSAATAIPAPKPPFATGERSDGPESEEVLVGGASGVVVAAMGVQNVSFPFLAICWPYPEGDPREGVKRERRTCNCCPSRWEWRSCYSGLSTQPHSHCSPASTRCC